ncbi:GNAT family N-acetyltransferase [Roseisolibacter sp. H3M3-2]|uniref:GNAT family N-acetyltransferase n=1 Tax=Roseisolibacter sp. H3M3-2 TaxID=3031323 RepID=UPI0023DC571B|nr:GNAT family N-acetyltransferase [Roseisolibacter sp. H3M3-2]MDF1504668.1 GNAT family N-acetyltransferase [Roseisolibacter sp. H3M3-2]
MATADDVPALVALMRAFYAESGYPLPEGPAARTFAVLVADPALGRVWLLEADGAPAGYLAMTVAFSMEHGATRAFVDDLFVLPAARGRGLAAAPPAAARADCAARGAHAMYVEVGPDDDGARRVYARAGFEDTGRVLLARALAAPLHLAE